MPDNADTGGRYGVIVGTVREWNPEQAADVIDQLEERFPGVTFALVAGATSVAFPLPHNDSFKSGES